jgi:tetratricopeptide (TPR) repeat protein
MNVYPRRNLFHQKPRINIYRLFFLIVFILGGMWLIGQLDRGQIKPLFLPTATPTRSVDSYALEGDALFIAGNLNGAITAYREAVQVDPSNAQIWAKLARIQTYSSSLLTTNPERLARLTEALASIDQAVKLAPDDSTVHAIRSFVLDWNASSSLVDDKQVQAFLSQAETEAIIALQKDNQNTLALAFYAEILVDQQKWDRGQQYIDQALQREDAPLIMDVHRVYAYVLESQGSYNQAIQEYDKAIAISPNLTFLLLRAGANYRRLAFGSLNEESALVLYEKSLEYFARAAQINEQLGVHDPVPYLSIAKTYSQTGDYFAAAINVQKALDYEPSNADTYGQLGIVFFKSRNYEGSIPALMCAVRGCAGEDSCKGRGLDSCNAENQPITVTGLALSSNTIVYYYTYGSVLAALSRPRDNKCVESLKVLDEVWQYYQTHEDIRQADTSIPNIVQTGQLICAGLGVNSSTVVTLPTSTVTPEPTSTSTATP